MFTRQFTGGGRVGKIIGTEAAQALKPCVLELGGKAPTVVCQDKTLLRLISSADLL